MRDRLVLGDRVQPPGFASQARTIPAGAGHLACCRRATYSRNRFLKGARRSDTVTAIRVASRYGIHLRMRLNMPRNSKDARLRIREVRRETEAAFGAAFRLLKRVFPRAELLPRRAWIRVMRER